MVKFSDIMAHEKYQNANDSIKLAIRDRYYDEIVRPMAISKVGDGRLSEIKTAFESMYPIARLQQPDTAQQNAPVFNKDIPQSTGTGITGKTVGALEPGIRAPREGELKGSLGGFAKEFVGGLDKTKLEYADRSKPGEPVSAETTKSEYGRIGKGFSKLAPWVGGTEESYDLFEVFRAGQRFEKGEASERDKDILFKYNQESQKEYTFGAKVGQTIAAMIPYAGEIGMTFGIYSGIKGATTATLKKGVEKYLGAKGAAMLAGRAVPLMTEIAGGIAGGAVQSVTNVPRITTGTMERMIGGESLFTAATKSVMDNAIEYISEHSAPFSKFGNEAKELAIKHGILRAVIKHNPEKSVSEVEKFMKKVGYHGVLNEWGEERIGDVGRALVGLEDWKLPTLEQTAVELVSFSIPGVTASLAGKALSSIGKIVDVEPEKPIGGEPGKIADVDQPFMTKKQEEKLSKLSRKAGLTGEQLSDAMDRIIESNPELRADDGDLTGRGADKLIAELEKIKPEAIVEKEPISLEEIDNQIDRIKYPSSGKRMNPTVYNRTLEHLEQIRAGIIKRQEARDKAKQPEVQVEKEVPSVPEDVTDRVDDTKAPVETVAKDVPETVAKPELSIKERTAAKRKELESVGKEVETEPTEAQKEAGNYKKGHINLQGLDISIENPAGSTRSGVDEGGQKWSQKMYQNYGYIKKTEGYDGDQVDVFINPKNPESETVFVIDQVKKDGTFDEHKVMMGFGTEAEAKAAYLKNYEAGWSGLGAINAMPLDEFKAWLKEGNAKKGSVSPLKVKAEKPTPLEILKLSDAEMKEKYPDFHKKRAADDKAVSKRESKALSDTENVISKLEKRLKELTAIRDDWASRVYKEHKGRVTTKAEDASGDPKKSTRTVGEINESRRQSAVANAESEYKDVSQKINTLKEAIRSEAYKQDKYSTRQYIKDNVDRFVGEDAPQKPTTPSVSSDKPAKRPETPVKTKVVATAKESTEKVVSEGKPGKETLHDALAGRKSATIGVIKIKGDFIKVRIVPDNSSPGIYNFQLSEKAGTSVIRFTLRSDESIDKVLKQLEDYLNEGRETKITVTKKIVPPQVAKELTLEDEKRKELKRLRGMKYGGRGKEIKIDKIKQWLKLDVTKWGSGDGVGYRVSKDQINRGFRIIEIDAENKEATIRQVADTGLTSTGGNFDVIEDQVVEMIDLVRDRKYDKAPEVRVKDVPETVEIQDDITGDNNIRNLPTINSLDVENAQELGMGKKVPVKLNNQRRGIFEIVGESNGESDIRLRGDLVIRESMTKMGLSEMFDLDGYVRGENYSKFEIDKTAKIKLNNDGTFDVVEKGKIRVGKSLLADRKSQPTPAESQPVSGVKEPWQMTRDEFEKADTFPQIAWDDIKKKAEYINISGTLLATLSKDITSDGWRITKWDSRGPYGHEVYNTKEEAEKELDQSFIKRDKIVVKINKGIGYPSKNYAGFSFKPRTIDSKGDVRSFIGDKKDLDWITRRLGSGGYSYEVIEPPAIKQEKTQTSSGDHELIVAQALSEGKPVPPEVLKDYPDLKPEAKPAEGGVEAPKSVTTRQRIPDDDLSTRELVQRIRADYPTQDAQSTYGRFVAARHLKPEIDAKEFGKLFNSVGANAHVRTETKGFKPTHKDSVTKELVQFTKKPNGVWEFVSESGRTGGEIPGELPSRYESLSQPTPAESQPVSGVKEPWQMTREEFIDISLTAENKKNDFHVIDAGKKHFQSVKDAHKAGKDVPEANLDRYGMGKAKTPEDRAMEKHFAKMAEKDLKPEAKPAEGGGDADGLKKWFGKSVVVDKDGKPQVMYHGSPESDITEFQHGHTAYGIFFTPDESTADYYTGGKKGGRTYPVYLKIEKLADLDDAETFDKVAREAIFDLDEKRENQDELPAFLKDLYHDGYGKIKEVTEFFDATNDFESYKNDIGEDYTVEDAMQGMVDDMAIDFSDVEEFIENNKDKFPKLSRVFNSDFPVRSEELQNAQDAYGSQDFYMNYQDDFMHAAENMGYDGVVFTDPSSAGEPTSYVVFSPDQVRIVSEVAEKPTPPAEETLAPKGLTGLSAAENAELERRKKEVLKKTLGRSSMNIDPSVVVDLVAIGNLYVKSGVRTFADFSKRMIDDIGEDVKPYLRIAYAKLTTVDGLEELPVDTKEITGERDTVNFNKEGIRISRENLGFDELPEHHKITWKGIEKDLASRDIEVDYADALALSIITDPRPHTPEEYIILGARNANLIEQIENLAIKLDMMVDKGEAGSDEYIHILARKQSLEEVYDVVSEAGVVSGTQLGQSFGIRRAPFDKETYQVASILRNAKVSKGSKLTDDERDLFEEQAREIRELRKKVIEEQEKYADYLESEEKKAAQKILNRNKKKVVTAKRKETLKAEQDEIIKALTSLGYRLNDFTGVTAEASYLVGKLAINIIEQGAVTLEEIVAGVQEKFSTLSANDIYRSMNATDPKAVKKARAELSRRKVELKRQARLTIELEDEVNGVFKGKGVPRGEKSPEVKALEKKLFNVRNKRNAAVTEANRLKRVKLEIARTLAGESKTIKESIRKHPISAELKAALQELKRIKKQFADAKRELATREKLEAKIELAKQGIFEKGKPRKPASEELQRLRQEYADLKRNRSASVREKEAIRKLEERIALAERGEFLPTKPRRPSSEKVTRLRKKLRALETAFRKTEMDDKRFKRILEKISVIRTILARNEGIPERNKRPPDSDEIRDAKQAYLDIVSEINAREQIKELDRQLETGDIIIKPKAVPRKIPNSLKQANMDLFVKKREIRERLRELSPRSWQELIGEAFGVFRAAKATADMSFAFRQAVIYAFTHPVRFATKMLPRPFIAFFKQSTADEIEYDIKHHPNHSLFINRGLELTSTSGGFIKREEAFSGRLLQRIPVLGWPVRASERFNISLLNMVRMDEADQFLQRNPHVSDETLTAWMGFTNISTGRGDLGQFSGASQALGTALFSARLGVSRFQFPLQLVKHWQDPILRKEMALVYVKFFGTGMAILSMAALYGQGDDRIKVGWDWRDPDFGKIIINGVVRLDIWGGFVQAARLIAGLVGTVTDRTGLTGKYIPEHTRRDPYDILESFVEFKLNPAITTVHTMITGKNPVGERQEPTEVAVRSIIPIWIESLYDAVRDELIPNWGVAATGGLEFTGFSIQVYRKQMEYRTNTKKGEIKNMIKDDRRDLALEEEKNWNKNNPGNEIDIANRYNDKQARSDVVDSLNEWQEKGETKRAEKTMKRWNSKHRSLSIKFENNRYKKVY